jgi:penicillin-binding protein 2
LTKKIAILTLALIALAGAGLLVDAAARPAQTAAHHSTTTKKKVVHHYSKSSVHHVSSTRRRRPRWSPWNVSSFGDPAALDDPVGDDPAIRQMALQALGKWNGSIVVVDPNNGRILSLVNRQLALSSGFEPCSTFKPVVALEGLSQGVITPATRLYVGRRARISLTYALARSNNAFFSELGQMLGYDRLAYAAREFGFGEKAGFSIADESPGVFPSAVPEPGGAGNLAYIGEDMEVTPLQMAAAISAIANGGTLYYLQYPRTKEEVAAFQPKVRRMLTEFEPFIPEVRAGMAAAVMYGTARQAYDPAEQIFGKTGTCSEDGARLGWFVSYASQDNPKYVVVVLLRGGRPMFGPHAAEIAGRLYRDLYARDQSAQRANSAATETAGGESGK